MTIKIKTNSPEERTRLAEILTKVYGFSIHADPITVETFDDRHPWKTFPVLELNTSGRTIAGTSGGGLEPSLNFGEGLEKVNSECSEFVISGVGKYKAILDKDNKVVKVGCAKIPFCKVEEIAKAIKKLENQ